MTTYIMSKSRDGLHRADAPRGQSITALAETMTDMPGAQWEGIADDPRGFRAPLPGQEWRGWISAYRPGTRTRDVHIHVWVRAEADALTAIEDARDHLSEIESKRAAQIEARDEAIRAALADGMSAAMVAAHAGMSVPRVYQIRDGRR